MKTKYCALCEAEATHVIVETNTPLCHTCGQAYVTGQASPDHTLIAYPERFVDDQVYNKEAN